MRKAMNLNNFLIPQNISCLRSVIDLPGNSIGADGWVGIGKIFVMRWNRRVYNFLTFPIIWHQTEGAQGHMTHKDFTEHAQTTGSSHWACPVCQTLTFPVPTL